MKLAYQESEIAALLKKIPLGTNEMNTIRGRAEELREGTLCDYRPVLPLMLASFIFDVLCTPGTVCIGLSVRRAHSGMSGLKGFSKRNCLLYKNNLILIVHTLLLALHLHVALEVLFAPVELYLLLLTFETNWKHATFKHSVCVCKIVIND